MMAEDIMIETPIAVEVENETLIVGVGVEIEAMIVGIMIVGIMIEEIMIDNVLEAETEIVVEVQIGTTEEIMNEGMNAGMNEDALEVGTTNADDKFTYN